MLHFKDWKSLNIHIANGDIKRYITKREASEAATKYSWPKSKVVRICRRFEIIWIVGDFNILFSDITCPVGTKPNGDVLTLKFNKGE